MLYKKTKNNMTKELNIVHYKRSVQKLIFHLTKQTTKIHKNHS